MEVELKAGTQNSIARLVGLLFLVAMAVSIAGNGLALPIISDPEYLQAVVRNNTKLRVSTIFMLVNSISVVGIGVLMYPLLKQRAPFIALGYVATRIIESVVLIVGIINILSLTTLAEEYTKAGATDKSYILSLGKSAIGNNWYSYNIAMIILGVGSLFFCYTLFRLKLIPRYLSVLGLVGYVVLAASSLLAMLDFEPGLVVTIPVFVFEVVLGIWLIRTGKL